MIRNYFKIAIRNLLRHKAYTYINIGGLAIGIASCLLILLYVTDELSYDTFHKNGDRIFRVNTEIKFGDYEMRAPLTSDMMGQTLQQDYPQVEKYTRVYSFWDSQLIKKGDETYKESNIIYADSTFFDVFTFQPVSGNLKHALADKKSVVITESIARKYYGTANAAGNTLEILFNGLQVYKVAAVVKDPVNTHLKFNIIFPISNLGYQWGNYLFHNFHTYLLLRKGVDHKQFEKNFTQYIDKYFFPYAQQEFKMPGKNDFYKAGNRMVYTLIPVKDIHLYSNLSMEVTPTGTIQYVYIFSAVALFILLIACINFMNLTTARSANRAKEVGIRKVLGTERRQLIVQFLFESTVLAFIAVVAAILIVNLVLPWFNQLSGKNLSEISLSSPLIILAVILLPFVVGIVAGSYPALYLSGFIPGEIIKGKLAKGTKSGKLRNILVVFQFAASIILIASTVVIFTQMKYLQNKNLGYEKDQLIILKDGDYLGNNVEAFKNEMLNVPGVMNATVTGFLPVNSWRNSIILYKSPSRSASEGLMIQSWHIDYDYLNTFGLKLITGRNFSKDFSTDSLTTIINEQTAKELGYKDPLGKKVYITIGGEKEYTIIGVVKDFNYESLKQNIGALCFTLSPNRGAVTFKVNAAKIPAILKKAEAKWRIMSGGMPFNYTFVDDTFKEMYAAEIRSGDIALSFSILAILVSCLGLLGLAAFMAEQRTKEIGIRKVLGASVSSISLMLSKEFLKWIVVANVIAWPAAYYLMNMWLQDFAYRITLQVWFFAAAGLITMLIGLLTVSSQAIKAALANPVKSLKYE